MSPRPSIPRRRERILEAAEELILERGFDAMTVDALAAAVGISKGSVYLEFRGKEEILDAALAAATQRALAATGVMELDAEARSLGEAYRDAAAALLDEPLLCAALLDDRGVLGATVSRVRDDRYRKRHRMVEEWIRQLAATGRLRADVDPAALALALSSTTLGLLTAARTLGPLTREEILGALHALEVMVGGLETESGGSD